MKDEIKEIREYISCPQFGDDHYGKWAALRLDQRKKIKDLLDYITNLQEENEKVHKDFAELSEKYFFTKSRNEKAIKYIKGLCYIESKNEWFTYGDDLSPEHIVNILQGEDNTPENLYKYTPEKGFRLVGDDNE